MPIVLKSKTITISISFPPNKVYEFVSNLENMSKWAKTFCLAIKKSGNDWIITTPQGNIHITITGKNEYGILDHSVIPSPGVKIYVPMRVIPNGDGSELLFTIFQQPDMTEEMFVKDIGLVEQDLNSLKNYLEKSGG